MAEQVDQQANSILHWISAEVARSGRIDHFVVTGAGASHGARAGDSAPPLGKDLARYLLDWLEANDSRDNRAKWDAQNNPLLAFCPSPDLFELETADWLRSFLRAAIEKGDRGFELIAREFYESDPSRQQIDYLNRLLAFALLTGDGCAFLERKDGYDELLRKPGFADGRVAFITLNYDTLLEDALGRAGREYGHWGPRNLAGRPRGVAGIPVFKLHGSINWKRHVGASGGGIGSVGAAVAPQAGKNAGVVHSGPDRRLDTQIEVVSSDRSDAIYKLKSERESAPVLALYARGKPMGSNWGAVAICRWACRAAIRANPAASVTVIGTSVPTPEDDHRFTWVIQDLARLRGEKLYVDQPNDRWDRLGFNRIATTSEQLIGRAK